MIHITSNQNPIIKEVKSLKERKFRESKKLFFIEGIRFVEEALKDNAPIVRVLLSDQLLNSKAGDEVISKVSKGGHETFVLPHKLFTEISDTETPQGIMAVLKVKAADISDFLTGNNFLVILDSIQDPGNMGTIIRTADGAGTTGIISSKGCVDVYNPKVLRSTMGSIFHVPLYSSEDLVDTVKFLKSRGIKVCAAHLKGTVDYFNVDMRNNIALVIGNEANGISSEAAEACDLLVKIPMPGRSESLNASIAAGLLIYEVVRQRIQ